MKRIRLALGVHCNPNIVRDRKVSEKADILERARDSDFVQLGGRHFVHDVNPIFFVGVGNLTARGRVNPGKHVEERGFSRAVRSD